MSLLSFYRAGWAKRFHSSLSCLEYVSGCDMNQKPCLACVLSLHIMGSYISRQCCFSYATAVCTGRHARRCMRRAKCQNRHDPCPCFVPALLTLPTACLVLGNPVIRVVYHMLFFKVVFGPGGMGFTLMKDAVSRALVTRLAPGGMAFRLGVRTGAVSRCVLLVE